MADYKQQYQLWLEKAVDESVRESLLKMQDNDENMQDAFYKDIEFGTAGMRGIMEAGTNRINVYTLFRATTGVALYMKRYNMTSCAITYDSRNNSRMFSQVVSATLASHGIKVYFTRECMPTPYLSFMVRNYHTDMGINITASHNASPYNGYKVYDSEGCQLTDDAANELTAVIEGVDPFQSPIPRFADYENVLIVYSDEEMEERYKQSVIAQGLNSAEGIKAVYSPLNGAGYRVVPEVLKRVGLDCLTVVPEQAYPDGNFPTCPYPNPEKKEALTLALNLANSHVADVVFDVEVKARFKRHGEPVVEFYYCARKILDVVFEVDAAFGAYPALTALRSAVAQLVECEAVCGNGLGAARKIAYKVHNMNAEVDERTAARIFLGADPSAGAAVSAEIGCLCVVYFAELTRID